MAIQIGSRSIRGFALRAVAVGASASGDQHRHDLFERRPRQRIRRSSTARPDSWNDNNRRLPSASMNATSARSIQIAPGSRVCARSATSTPEQLYQGPTSRLPARSGPEPSSRRDPQHLFRRNQTASAPLSVRIHSETDHGPDPAGAVEEVDPVDISAAAST